jgi:hypothetical protein
LSLSSQIIFIVRTIKYREGLYNNVMNANISINKPFGLLIDIFGYMVFSVSIRVILKSIDMLAVCSSSLKFIFSNFDQYTSGPYVQFILELNAIIFNIDHIFKYYL